MPSPFAAAIKVAAATHDRIMGDTFDYLPMSAGNDVNARPVADVARAIVTGLLLPFGASSARVHSGPVHTVGATAERPGIASDRPFVSLQLSLLPYPPRTGDRLRNVDTGELFRIAEILPSAPGLARLDLNQIPNG